MKTLKYKAPALIALALASALALSACGAAGSSTASRSESSSAQSAAPAAPAAGGSSSAGSAEALSSTADVSPDSTEAGLWSESFSSRDLSGEYETAEAVTVTLNGASAEASDESVEISGGTVTITAAGTYILSGTLDDGTVVVDVSKDDKVQLVLDGVSITSADYAVIYVKQADKVFVTLADGSVNSLANGGSFAQKDDNDVNAVVFSKDDITFNGTGTLRISSPAGHGISGKDEVTVTGGVYEIAADGHAIRAKDSLAIADGSFRIYANEDGLHAENSDDESLGSIYIAGGSFEIEAKDDAVHAITLLQIDGGTLSITAAEGLEATYIRINGGEISISASDDGVNAARKSSVYTPTF